MQDRQTTVYLASPYSDPDPAVREARYEAACRTAAHLMWQGRIVFSPISHSHGIPQYDLPVNWNFWEACDRQHLDVCSEVVVLMLDGWEQSRGVQAEIAIARELGKPVSFIDPNDLAAENPDQCRGE